MKYIIAVLAIISLGGFGAYNYFNQDGVGGTGTINQLSQFKFDGTYITQNVADRLLKLTGYESAGDCLKTDASGVVSTGSCGGGGSSKWSDLGSVLIPLAGESIEVSSIAATGTATSTFSGPLVVNGTTTIPNLNGVIYVDGVKYAKTGAGIQSAVNSACSQGGGVVQLSFGTYLVSSQIELCSNLSLFGYGTSTILRPQSNISTIYVDGKANINISKIMIDGADSVVSTGASGIRVKNSTNIHIENNVIVNQTAFAVFVEASGVSTSSKIWIKDNFLEGEGTSDVIGGGPQNSTGAIVKDVYVLNNNVTQDCTTNSYCNAFDLVAMQNFIVQGNIFYGIVQPGSEQFPHSVINISNNNIYPAIGETATALYVSTRDTATANSTRIIISNNNIESGTLEVFGTSTAPISGVTISGNNILAGPLNDGISLKHAQNVAVSGNTIDGGESGIELATSSDFIINANMVNGANYGIKTDLISSGIAIGVNRFSNILNVDVLNQPGVNIIRESGTQTADLAFRDTNYDFDATGGKFYISNWDDELGIFRGVAGINGVERLQIDSQKVTFGDFAVQDRTLGVFNGTDLMRFRATGDSFINNGYNLGLGIATATERLHVSGGLRLTGNFMDSVNATGTLGQILQSTGTSTLWVATSTLGITGGTTYTGTYPITVSGSVISTGFSTSTTNVFTGLNTFQSTTTLASTTVTRLGVGTVSPVQTLDVSSPTNYLTALFRGSAAPNIGFVQSAGTSPIWKIGISGNVGTNLSISSGTGATDVMSFSGSNVGIGTTTPGTRLSVTGTSTFTGRIVNTGAQTLTTGNALCYLATGEYIFAGGTTCVTSSLRWKQDIENLDSEAWKELLKLDVKNFNYKAEYADNVRDAGGKRLGVIAEEVEKIDPRLVQYGSDGKPLTVHFDGLITLLIQAVQEQQKMLGTAKQSAQDNYQWLVIGLLALVIIRQQWQLNKIVK